jgi:hypothetical protein
MEIAGLFSSIVLRSCWGLSHRGTTLQQDITAFLAPLRLQEGNERTAQVGFPNIYSADVVSVAGGPMPCALHSKHR